MKISIVIPTLNEQYWLPRLLNCLQGISEVGEIIVVDNNSSDETKNIAKNYNCKILSGLTPAISRNIGGNSVCGDIIIFLDADVLVNHKIVLDVIALMKDRKVVAVHYKIYPLTNSKFVRFCYAIMDYYFLFLSKIGVYQGTGNFIAIRKEAFTVINGFNAKILFGEDNDFYRRISKIGKVIYSRQLAIYVSTRRFFIECPFIYSLKCAMCSFLRILGFKFNILPYKWTGYPQYIAQYEDTLLENKDYDWRGNPWKKKSPMK